MNIHEYQAKEIFARFGVPVPVGKMITKAEDAALAAREIGGNLWAVKAQIHAGGRGKGGGVKIARSIEETELLASRILGMNLITQQTGPSGKIVKKVYIEAGTKIQKEYYLGIVLDRSEEMPVIIASSEGGMEIEKVAAETPEKILKVPVDPLCGLRPFLAGKLAFGLGLSKIQAKVFERFIRALFSVYQSTDASLIEINPLVLTTEGDFLALDAKINFDDNALDRHPEIESLRDMDEEEETEREAAKYGLNYVKLSGNVGCMVNGAGLAMATMDIIKLNGGEPANFLDVGGGASAESVSKGFEIILHDPNVKAILINIFGGIVRCDRIAMGILDANQRVGVNVPLIVRLEGTNAAEAAELLRSANIDNIITAFDLEEGAIKAVKAAGGRS